MDRRTMLSHAGAALAAGCFPLSWSAAADAPKRKLLMFTRSQGYEHDVIKCKDDKLSLAETIVTDLGKTHGFDVTCTKDGRVFLPEEIAKYDAFLFETTGDLTAEGGDKNPPMPAEGKKAFLKAIADGKGFVGCHCAADTFHLGEREEAQPLDKVDPYVTMLGGEFIHHDAQQKARMQVIDNTFPGAKGLKDFELLEEWYSLKNFAPNLHVLLVQDTQGMKGLHYERPSYPATWARKYEKGHVFYTSMGHRDDVWKSQMFQDLLVGALSWAFGNVEADVTPNIAPAAPKANEMPPKK